MKKRSILNGQGEEPQVNGLLLGSPGLVYTATSLSAKTCEV